MDKIAEDVVSQLAQGFALFLVTKIGKKIKDKRAHDAIYFQTAYENYLTASKERNEKIKTLLYKQAPQDLYDFYECIGVRSKDKVIDTSDIRNLFSLGNKLIITGTGGIGKTIMMKHLFLNCIANTDYIPILVELRGLNDKSNPNEIDISDFIFNNLHTFHFELEREYFDYSLSLGKYVFIFDGYDEVKNTLASTVASLILQLSDRYPDNKYIVSSRPLDGRFVAWSNFLELDAMCLSKKQALSLVSKLKYDCEIKDKFYAELKERLYDKYETFASNPLLLTIMLMTFAEGGEIPENFNEFYEQAYIALYKAHDASKGAYIRDKAAALGINDFKRVFSYICFQSFFKSRYEFKETEILELISRAKNKCKEVKPFASEDFLRDLTDSVCLLVRDGLNLRFTHRSFQEYFAAYHVTQLDDETQIKLIKEWIINRSFAESSFLKVLQCMEPARFEKNVLIPGLVAISDKSRNLKREEIVKLVSSQIVVRDDKHIGLLIEDRYHYAIFQLIPYKQKRSALKKQYEEKSFLFYNKLKQKGLISDKGKTEIYVHINIDKIMCDNELKSFFVDLFSSIYEEYDLGMKILEQSNKTEPAGISSLNDMLDNI